MSTSKTATKTDKLLQDLKAHSGETVSNDELEKRAEAAIRAYREAIGYEWEVEADLSFFLGGYAAEDNVKEYQHDISAYFRALAERPELSLSLATEMGRRFASFNEMLRKLAEMLNGFQESEQAKAFMAQYQFETLTIEREAYRNRLIWATGEYTLKTEQHTQYRAFQSTLRGR